MGRVAAPYGVKGWCNVQPFSEDPNALLEHRVWWLRQATAASWQQCELTEVRPHSGALVAKLTGVESREQALALRGTLIGVPRESLPRAEGEFFWSDLVGFEVYDRAGRSLGQVEGLTDNGAHPILRVRDPAAAGAREHLIPWVAIYIDRVDAQARRIDVDWDPDY
jgi:16S rRNA processing protein RimM